MTSRLDRLRSVIQPVRQQLLAHPIYQDIARPAALRTFMEHHVYAVWDFMSLLKALQQRFCGVAVPWVPAPSPTDSRFINEIVLGEESDEDGRGGFASHFELYRRSMLQFGADTSRIDRFLQALRNGVNVSAALEVAAASAPIRQFVEHTFDVIASDDPCQIASAFTFGREDLLPDVFRLIVEEVADQLGGELDDFVFYLRRHVELDSEEHGPMAARLISSLCGDDEIRWQAAEQAAVAALEARLHFWNAIHAEILTEERV